MPNTSTFCIHLKLRSECDNEVCNPRTEFDMREEIAALREINRGLLEALADIMHRASPTGNNVLLRRIVAIAKSAIKRAL